MALTRQRITLINNPPETTCNTRSATYGLQDKAFNGALKVPVVAVQGAQSSTRVNLTSKRKRSSKTSKWPTSPTVMPSRRLEASPQEDLAATTTLPSQCPFMTPEFHKIQARHRTLASTGCTAQFCQAGRMLHTDEPRVGENRSLKLMEHEARDFLEALRLEKFFDSDEAFCERLRAVLKEIRGGATDGIIRQNKTHGKIGGNWSQTPAELEFGLRRAWRNSRKCIMRSHCEELKLCDLRAITTSTSMATELIKGLSEAFNSGNIQPTVFVFPPRKASSRGPMIWNHQILAFAGYEVEDGSILGDPMSRELTKAIIELGWKSPEPRSKWDLLPIVTMADGDVPVIAELPNELRQLVEIRHPQYGKEFERLDLKWVAFPALTRLGFDIGGVQYTATPFIGWFMDAEIGVRNLADSFRYNALPDIVEALGLASGKIGEIAESFEDLPEFERLQMLSRAQSELNYAVHWSFSQAKVSMTDSLSASIKWSRYDDEFNEKNGFRLPADPYWLAPPQGSIIPLWHRGGAPNYQPKPMICKHVQDPLKVWAREKPDWFISAKELGIVANVPTAPPTIPLQNLILEFKHVNPPGRLKHAVPTLLDEKFTNAVVEEIEVLPRTASLSVEVYYCSAGMLAEKIATKLHDRAKSLVAHVPAVDVSASIAPLDHLGHSSITRNKIFLLVVSSTGQGDIPANGIHFVERCQDMIAKNVHNIHFRFAIYGNGDTRYSGTYNGAAKRIQLLLRDLGGRPIAGGLFDGDTALQATAFQALNPWWSKLQPAIQDVVEDPSQLERIDGEVFERPRDGGFDIEECLECFRKHSQRLDSQYRDTTLIATSQQVQPGHSGSYVLTFDIDNEIYEDLGCIQFLPVNSRSKLRRVLRVLSIGASAPIELYPENERCPSYSRFLSEFVDLEAPFTHLGWLEKIPVPAGEILEQELLESLSVLEVFEVLQKRNLTTELTKKLSAPSGLHSSLRLEICLAMPILVPRNYSIASSQPYLSDQPSRAPTTSSRLPRTQPAVPSPHNLLQTLIKPQPNGRFSSTFLTDNPAPTALKYRLVDSACGPSLRTRHSTPLIIIATGAGFAPVRCLLQRRILAARSTVPPSSPLTVHPLQEGKISLYLGLKPVDIPLVTDLLMEAARWGVLDVMSVVPSNEGKVRVYEKLEDDEEGVRRKIVDEGGRVFVCAGVEAARAVNGILGRVLSGVGENIRRMMGGRYVEEIF